jgi:formate hydrogenlyase subunit 3/multisubunit Na+/H+ antiporter MnhD subunit
MMTLVMFSMAGVPPMVGFMAKLLVLEAVIDIGWSGWRWSPLPSRSSARSTTCAWSR